jgi:nitroreductase
METKRFTLEEINSIITRSHAVILEHIDIKKAVIRSQHCQRNFDLSQQIPAADLETLVYAATNCPSKQNIAFYNLHVITDREVIERVHELAPGTHAYNESGELIATTNSQVLANAIFVYEQLELTDLTERGFTKWQSADESDLETFKRDRATAIGIASGYVNLTASMLGYSTGCCQCFLAHDIKEYLGLKNNPAMVQGVGFKDASRNRRLHEKNGLMFPTRKKEEIVISYR